MRAAYVIADVEHDGSQLNPYSIADVQKLNSPGWKAWSDGNTEANRTIVISSDTTLAASFKEKAVGVQYTLTISAGAHGSVNTAVNGKYDEGTNVTIIATADAGYHFDKWSDGNTNATRNITITSDTTLEASFKEKSVVTQYTLTISAGEHGSVNEAVNGKYDAGSSVNIIATADEGYV